MVYVYAQQNTTRAPRTPACSPKKSRRPRGPRVAGLGGGSDPKRWARVPAPRLCR